MANKNVTTENAPKKRRFYHNIKDSYNVGRRSYPALAWILLSVFIATIAVFLLIGYAINYFYYMLFLGILTSILVVLSTLSFIVRKAMYKQIDGHLGAVSAVLSQVKRGWIIDEQPVAFNKNQDLVWRAVGRNGIILISEGPSTRVRPLLDDEAKKYTRVVPNVPIHKVQVGNEENQIPLSKLLSTIRKLKGQTKLTSREIPAVAKRLSALQAQKGMPMPKGIDPMKMKNMKRQIR
ncbi:DUF4191 domain-containing protein [Actinomyces sp. zg-332]|uniref:DUF4191 domain-containing protein n=1 Tax=Actinomyces sp. zg-332 TaxID=2708340 RepID=UPI0014243B38|nr:DUF4191 domain-containing protein [Actinomyces sp. zg-332]QPK93783.1 DUF4191 domain-containing protein [Actinomyces sp. zg-332]